MKNISIILLLVIIASSCTTSRKVAKKNHQYRQENYFVLAIENEEAKEQVKYRIPQSRKIIIKEYEGKKQNIDKAYRQVPITAADLQKIEQLLVKQSMLAGLYHIFASGVGSQYIVNMVYDAHGELAIKVPSNEMYKIKDKREDVLELQSLLDEIIERNSNI